ncbi:hypothetical protein BDQ17DRAFT_1332487 [Cyathus striatus]|nr:hypothetical protein BDQ17DRAFT_1332487 [Cyathus striatus]
MLEGGKDVRRREEDYHATVSLESGTVPEYPIGIVIPPREKEGQSDQDVAEYEVFTLQQMEGLHEQRKKMRDLIEVLKERRASASSMAKSQIDLEEGTPSVEKYDAPSIDKFTGVELAL